MNLLATLAWRYLKSGNKTFSPLMLLSFLSIMISSALLILVLSIMKGFEHTTYRQLKGIHADLIIESTPTTSFNIEKVTEVLDKEFPTLLWSPSSSSFVIVSSSATAPHTVALLKAIDPYKEDQTSKLSSYIPPPSAQNLESILGSNSILLGKKLAEDLQLSIGKTCTLIYSNGSFSKIRNLQQEAIPIGGIFETGIEDIDSHVIYCSFDVFNSLLPEIGITQINIQVPYYSDLKQIQQTLHNRFGLPVYSWKDLYPALVSALQLETYTMGSITLIIVIMALLTIVSVLFMLINQKKRDIALLRSLGVDAFMLKKLFIVVGVSIATSGTLAGLCIGGLIGLLLQHYPLFTLPDIYLIKHLPVHLDPTNFLVIGVFVILVSIVISWRTARNATETSIADILQFER